MKRIIICIIVLAILFFIEYQIAISGLSPWVKFWLLK